MIDSNITLSESTLNFFLDEVLDSVKIAIVVLNANYSINIINTGFMNIFGYKQDELQNRSIDVLFNSDEFKILRECMKNADYSNNLISEEKFELNAIHHDKTIIPLEITIIKSYEDKNPMYIFIMRNIREFKQTIENLKYLAYYDQLTSIPNRTLFRDRSETAVRLAGRDKSKLAIVYIDIDNFKIINDTMGHESGDILLKALSRRFQECVRDSDTVSRIGGDEFAILMLKITSLKDASLMVERILKSNLIPVKINDQDIIPKVSFGISIYPKDGDNIDMLLKNSDIAMYFAKGNGKNQFVFYKPNMINETK